MWRWQITLHPLAIPNFQEEPGQMKANFVDASRGSKRLLGSDLLSCKINQSFKQKLQILKKKKWLSYDHWSLTQFSRGCINPLQSSSPFPARPNI